MKWFILKIFLFSAIYMPAQEILPFGTSRLSLLFMGDIMGHDAQIESAVNSTTRTFSYDTCFIFVKNIFNNVDLAIANLEVTLAGPPFKGYPDFSSPDELAVAIKNAGIDILGTANNHSCDKNRTGIIRTIRVLDSLQIQHTGTFQDSLERASKYPLMLEKNDIRLALLNYTYGTNGIPVPSPAIVNLIDTSRIKEDIFKAKSMQPDMIILFIHWGNEYQLEPCLEQISIAEYCFGKGVDIIIGSHPHVIQKMELLPDSTGELKKCVIWSLGNYISNQRTPPRDGGAMVQINLEKDGLGCHITTAGYYLTWVYTPVSNSKKYFLILPVSEFEDQPGFFENPADYQKMKIFTGFNRELLSNQNMGVKEYIFDAINNQFILQSEP